MSLARKGTGNAGHRQRWAPAAGGLPEDISGGEAIQPWAVVAPWEGQRWELLGEVPLASMGLQQK